MKVSYDLTFITDNTPFSSNFSEIYFRTPEFLGQSLEYFKRFFPGAKLYHASLQGDLTKMVTTLQDKLEFTADVSHSLDAFGDYLCNMFWLEADHVILIVEFTDKSDRLDKCMIIDTLAWAVNMLNMERKVRLSVLVLV